MKTKNKIELSNPFMNISGKKEREALEKDLKFCKDNILVSRFIRRRIVFFMDGYRYAAQAVKKRWGISFSFFESGHDQIKKAYTTENLEKEAGKLWWDMMNKDKGFSKQLVKELLDIIELEKTLAKTIPQRNLSRKEMEEYMLMHLDWWISFFEVVYLWFCAEDIKQMTEKGEIVVIDTGYGSNYLEIYDEKDGKPYRFIDVGIKVYKNGEVIENNIKLEKRYNMTYKFCDKHDPYPIWEPTAFRGDPCYGAVITKGED